LASNGCIGTTAECGKKLRESKGLTQAALAQKVAVSREYIARLEMGRLEALAVDDCFNAEVRIRRTPSEEKPKEGERSGPMARRGDGGDER
jgi:transcriptional regulator with XRE-family HTH domain